MHCVSKNPIYLIINSKPIYSHSMHMTIFSVLPRYINLVIVDFNFCHVYAFLHKTMESPSYSCRKTSSRGRVQKNEMLHNFPSSCCSLLEQCIIQPICYLSCIMKWGNKCVWSRELSQNINIYFNYCTFHFLDLSISSE